MRKIGVYCIILCLLAMPLYAEIHGFFEAGYAIGEGEDAVFTEIELQWWRGGGFVRNELYGGIETWAINIQHPFKALYTIGDRVHFGNFYLQIEHGCNHAVYSPYNKDWWHKNLYTTGDLTTFSAGIKW